MDEPANVQLMNEEQRTTITLTLTLTLRVLQSANLFVLELRGTALAWYIALATVS